MEKVDTFYNFKGNFAIFQEFLVMDSKKLILNSMKDRFQISFHKYIDD